MFEVGEAAPGDSGRLGEGFKGQSSLFAEAAYVGAEGVEVGVGGLGHRVTGSVEHLHDEEQLCTIGGLEPDPKVSWCVRPARSA